MDIPQKVDSKFRFVLLSAHRAEQMVRGARPKMEHTSRKPSRRAMAEIQADAVNWDYGPEPQPEAPPQES